MMAQLQTTLGLFGRVRKQLWIFLAAMAISGVMMALGVIYLTPAHEDVFTAAPETPREAVVQSRG